MTPPRWGWGNADTPELVPTPFPAADWPEAPASVHPPYTPTFDNLSEPTHTLIDPVANGLTLQAAASTQALEATVDTEAGKSGVVSGFARATLDQQREPVALGALQLQVARAGGDATQPVTIDAAVLPVEEAKALSPVDMAFRLAVSDGVGASALTQPLQLTLDYSQIPLRYGGSLAERLTLYRVSACADGIAALAEGEPAPSEPCLVWEALPGTNNPVAQQLTVVLTHTTTSAAHQESSATDQPANPALGNTLYLPLARNAGNTPTLADDDGELYVLAAAATSQQGNYAATPLANVGDYQVSLSTGSAQTGYPIPIPPAAAGLAPNVVLNYDSGSVDGMTSNKNNQPGWAGIG